jgi:hypothetical protein
MRLALSQVKALSWLRPGSGIPSISTAYAQARRRCAQVIHMFVHRQQESSPLAWLTGSSRSARRCLRARPAGRRRRSARAWMRSPQEGSYRMIAVARGQAARASTAARRSRESRSAADCASSIRSSCPGCAAGHARLRCRNHKPKHDTLVPSPPSPSRTIRPAGPSRASDTAATRVSCEGLSAELRAEFCQASGGLPLVGTGGRSVIESPICASLTKPCVSAGSNPSPNNGLNSTATVHRLRARDGVRIRWLRGAAGRCRARGGVLR